MQSSIVSLPFVALYLVHAWLFTFDVLLLSRRRARTPVAIGTVCVLIGALLYAITTCGHLPRIDVTIPELSLRGLGLSGRLTPLGAEQPPGSTFWTPPAGNHGRVVSCRPPAVPDYAHGGGGGGGMGNGGAGAASQSQQTAEHKPDRSSMSGNQCSPPIQVVSDAQQPKRQEVQQKGALEEQQKPTGPQPKPHRADRFFGDSHMNFSNFVSSQAVLPCVHCPDNREWFLEQLTHLSRRVDNLQAQMDKCDCNSPKVGQMNSHLDAAIQRALRLYDADKTGLADYALESAGGSVLSTRCTETYDTSMGRLYLFGFIPLFWQRPSPRLAIQPTLAVGECWPFKGTIGYLVIQLSRRVKIEAFTLEHIPASLAPTGNIDSAPNQFEVYGLDTSDDTEGVFLGNYSYAATGEPLQHFEVQQDVGDRTFEVVELKILTNHGNIHYTCLYRFRVHGKPVQNGKV